MTATTERIPRIIEWFGPEGRWLLGEIIAPFDAERFTIEVDGAMVIAHRDRLREVVSA